MKYILFWLPGCANPSFYLTLLSGNNAVTTVGKPLIKYLAGLFQKV